ncbi:MAG TPA: hypothetical protein VFY84_19255 [Jiangellales bacterium]|nr:hypothetical protein [Jiangellales bacterium]
MARNIKRYGYGPNRTSDTPAVVVVTGQLHKVQRLAAHRRTPEQRAAAIAPLEHGKRVLNYMRQNDPPTPAMPRDFTPRQNGRMRRKLRVGATAWALGIRSTDGGLAAGLTAR